MIRFVHTADIHFGMENYGKIDPHTGIHTRLLDFNKALNYCIDYAIEQDVDFFLFAGDAYKTAHPTPTQQRLFTNCFLRLHKAGIPIVMVVGNHDHPLSFGKNHVLESFKQFPLQHVYVVDNAISSFVLYTKSGPVTIVGIPWPTRNKLSLNHFYERSAQDVTEAITDAVCERIEEISHDINPNIPAVLTGHLTVSTGIFSGSEKRAIYGSDPLFSPGQLALYPFDYVGLGHLHRFQNLNAEGATPVIYSGSVERIDFGERKEEKGFCSVTIHDKSRTTYEFIPTPTRPFIQLDVHLHEHADQTEQILDKLKEYDLHESIIKIVYHVPATDQDRVNTSQIAKACADAHYLVGIIPVKKVQTREKRTISDSDMDIHTLLSLYIDSKTDLQKDKERLIQKARELINNEGS
jgi:exonuclease SbcD